jgi:hypothetical protein
MAIRRRQDRRCWTDRKKFPFRDSSGERVCEDRRRQPDRRLSAIEAEWLQMAHEMERDPVPVVALREPLEGQ